MTRRETQVRGKDARDTSLAARIVRVLPYVGVLVAIVILAVPSVADLMEALRASSTISTLSSTVDVLPAEQKQRLLDQAHRHNARLAGDASAGAGDGTGADEELLPYEEQLSTDDTTIMGWLDIPSIAVRLPVYHGTSIEGLSAGVGHLEQSSLPVGGASTHCVLTAHSGVAASRMFDDIRLLEPGDVFVLWTLGDPYAYEVTGSEVVLPDELSSLHVVAGEDLCTLVTCTPYGVNSHRLLVHARRCAYDAGTVSSTPTHVSSRNVPIYVALALVAVTILVAVLVRRKRTASGRGTFESA